MIDREDAARMIGLANVDLKAMRNMLDPDLFEDSVFGFHAQQAVEKAFKAWLTLRGVAYRKTHDIRLLMNLLESRAREDCQRFEELADLGDFAVQFRYDFIPPSAQINRQDTLAVVESLISHCERLIEAVEASE